MLPRTSRSGGAYGAVEMQQFDGGSAQKGSPTVEGLKSAVKSFDLFPRLKEEFDSNSEIGGFGLKGARSSASVLSTGSNNSGGGGGGDYCLSFSNPRALIMLLSQILVFWLTCIEITQFLEVRVKQKFVVDNNSPEERGLASWFSTPDPKDLEPPESLMRVRFNVTIEDLPCHSLSLDYQNVMGVRAVDVKTGIWKKRLHRVEKEGQEPTFEPVPGVAPLPNDPGDIIDADHPGIHHRKEGMSDEECGSCYGALPTTECCDSCSDVLHAYRLKRWSLPRIEQITQCKSLSPEELEAAKSHSPVSMGSMNMGIKKDSSSPSAYIRSGGMSPPSFSGHSGFEGFGSSLSIRPMSSFKPAVDIMKASWDESKDVKKYPQCQQSNVVVQSTDDQALFVDLESGVSRITKESASTDKDSQDSVIADKSLKDIISEYSREHDLSWGEMSSLEKLWGTDFDGGSSKWGTVNGVMRGPGIDTIRGCKDDDCKKTDKFKANSADLCSLICRAVDGCNYWSHGFEMGARKCWLRKASKEISWRFGYKSGSKYCYKGKPVAGSEKPGVVQKPPDAELEEVNKEVKAREEEAAKEAEFAKNAADSAGVAADPAETPPKTEETPESGSGEVPPEGELQSNGETVPTTEVSSEEAEPTPTTEVSSEEAESTISEGGGGGLTDQINAALEGVVDSAEGVLDEMTGETQHDEKAAENPGEDDGEASSYLQKKHGQGSQQGQQKRVNRKNPSARRPQASIQDLNEQTHEAGFPPSPNPTITSFIQTGKHNDLATTLEDRMVEDNDEFGSADREREVFQNSGGSKASAYRHLENVDKHAQEGEACQVYGWFDTGKVPGNFHISFATGHSIGGGSGPMFMYGSSGLNQMSHSVSRHTIHELSFLELDSETNEPIEIVNPALSRNGVGTARDQLSPTDLRSHFSPLHAHHLPDKAQVSQYYLTVTPNTDQFHSYGYKPLLGYHEAESYTGERGSKRYANGLRGYQYSAQGFVTTGVIDTGIYFRYELDPIRVLYTDGSMSYNTFVSHILMIFGGVIGTIQFWCFSGRVRT